MKNRGEIKEVLTDENTWSRIFSIKIEGSNRFIGQYLGEVVRDRTSITHPTVGEQFIYRAQRSYMQKNYPSYNQRITGYSSVFNENEKSAKYDCSYFGSPLGDTLCSAIYYPPQITENNKGTISRNLDFAMDDSSKNSPFKNIYIQELHPENCYASVSIVCFEVFGQALEGINSEGLCVVHLADGESSREYNQYCSGKRMVGFNEFLPIQYLLDNCATLEEAAEALLKMKHYYHSVPVHLLISDSSGNSFVWERTPWGNNEVIIKNNTTPQIVTNFLLHKYDLNSALPINKEDPNCEFLRYTKLNNALKNKKTFSDKDIEDNNSLVYFRPLKNNLLPTLGRTLMHSIYTPIDKKVKIKFYKRDTEDCNILFSKFIEFKL